VEGLPGSRPTPSPSDATRRVQASSGTASIWSSWVNGAPRRPRSSTTSAPSCLIGQPWRAAQARSGHRCSAHRRPSETGLPRTSSRTPRWAILTRSSWSARISRGLRHREQPHHHAVSQTGARWISSPASGAV